MQYALIMRILKVIKPTYFLSYLSVLSLMLLLFSACKKDTDCFYNGKSLYKERGGGCFYEDENCEKVYVSDSECNC